MTSHMRSVTPPPPPSSSGGSVQLSSSASTTTTTTSTSSKPKSLMENLLIAKMEQVALGASGNISAGPQGRTLLRTDSVDSTSSIGSITSLASDVCRCDDCLLGIADLYAQECEETRSRKKVNSIKIYCLFFFC